MSKDFEARHDEWVKWYFEHVNDGVDVHQQIKFLKKALEGVMELFAHARADIRALEGRPKHDLGTPLYLPRHLSVRR